MEFKTTTDFFDHILKYRKSVALSSNTHQLSYTELVTICEQVAYLLRQKYQPADIIAIKNLCHINGVVMLLSSWLCGLIIIPLD